MTSAYRRAIEFGTNAHRNQVRKYTGEPYFNHCLEVATMAAAYLRVDNDHPAVIAALLHDTVEDTETSFTEIEKEFGALVADHVFWLTDTITHAMGNRATRTRLNSLRLSRAPYHVKVIKLCDLISNCRSIVERDPKFAVQYLVEKKQLLDLIEEEMRTNPAFVTARGIVEKGVDDTALATQE